MEAQEPRQPDWLVQTKLHPPLLREDVIPRPRLVDALHRALTAYPLTLVSAPAGYGKTTLLAGLRQGDKETRRRGDGLPLSPSPPLPLPLAWLTLDEEDNDPARFLAALIAALRRLNPACATTAQTVLTSLPNPGAGARRIIGVLINDVLETLPDPFAVILDDLHLITEPGVFGALDYLLEHRPPQMHLAVGTRHDPPLSLARLRARGQLAELRLVDLRFTLDETTRFLNEKLGLNLSADDLTILQQRTEGWPAGLRLLATSLDHIPTAAGRTAFIQDLAQTDRYVFDFLAEEVLDRQEPEVRAFLLETSILSELTPSLCQAVTNRSDAPAILQDVYRRNLFLIAVGGASDQFSVISDPSSLDTDHWSLDTGHWQSYRYHALFAGFLRQQLEREMPARVHELHRRAAEAFRGDSSTAVPTNLVRAIPHYLTAGLWEQATRAVEQVGDQLVQDGSLNTLRGWIKALPASLREEHPRLLYFLGMWAVQQGALDEATLWLERARRGFEAIGSEAEQGEVLSQLVNVAGQQHNHERLAVLIPRALEYPLPPHGRVQLLMARAWQLFYQGDWNQVDADVGEALQITLESGEPDAFNVLAPILRMQLALLPSGAERLERYCRQALARFGEGIGPVQAGAHSLLGYIHFLRGQLDQAFQEAERARAISRRLGGFTHLDAEVAFVLMSVSFARSDYSTTQRGWEAKIPWFEQTPAVQFWTVLILYLLGRTQWIQGNLDQAGQTYARMRAIASPQEFPEITVARAQMYALLAISEERYADAARALRQVVPLEQRMRPCVAFTSAQLLLTYLYWRWNRPQDALSELAGVLGECERNGTPGLILQEGAFMIPVLRLAVEQGVHATFAAHLLDLLGASEELQPVFVPDTGETLTRREVEVLQLLVTGATNREIAEQLVISQSTVKTHVHHILNKLDVTTRTEAAARARDLRLV